jgi:HNH endonuclease
MRISSVGSINERFSKRFVVDDVSGCWNWTGTSTNDGYGLIAGVLNGKRYVKAGQKMLAHRVSWLMFRGEIPEGDGYHGTIVMHKCDNPRCVNPDHLMLGTQADNVKDMIVKGRKVAGEYQKRKGVEHFRSAFKDQADIDYICSIKGRTKELAEKYGVTLSTIKRIRRRNGFSDAPSQKFAKKSLSPEAIAHIRSTPSGTRGLGKLYGIGKTAIANIRKGLTYAC